MTAQAHGIEVAADGVVNRIELCNHLEPNRRCPVKSFCVNGLFAVAACGVVLILATCSALQSQPQLTQLSADDLSLRVGSCGHGLMAHDYCRKEKASCDTAWQVVPFPPFIVPWCCTPAYHSNDPCAPESGSAEYGECNAYTVDMPCSGTYTERDCDCGFGNFCVWTAEYPGRPCPAPFKDGRPC